LLQKSPIVTSKQNIQLSLASAKSNFNDQVRGLESLSWKSGATILDIGCGPGIHLDYFRSKNLVGTGLDRNPDYFLFHGQIEHVESIRQLDGRQFDYVFASHVLEHYPNTFATIAEWRCYLRDGGTLIVFVPPFANDVSDDHWATGWNVGQLAMTFVAAGFDCRQSTFYQTANQVFGFGQKHETAGSFMIAEALPFLPPAMKEGLSRREFTNLRGDIAYVHGNAIEFFPRRPAVISAPMPDDSWVKVDPDGWSDDAIAMPSKAIKLYSEYVLAVESADEGHVRVAFTHDNVKAHAELWIRVIPGMNFCRFEPIELADRTSDFHVEMTDQIMIGGPTKIIRAALFCEDLRIA
jgi:SAM-dependent methyltransferase